MVMHLAIALVTYNALVRLAPVGPAVPASREPQHARQKRHSRLPARRP
jgi:hypothetical protein